MILNSIVLRNKREPHQGTLAHNTWEAETCTTCTHKLESRLDNTMWSPVSKKQNKIVKYSLLRCSSLHSLLSPAGCLAPPTNTLKPLFNLLKGDKRPSFPRTLSSEAIQALNSIHAALRDMVLARYNPTMPIQLIFNPSPILRGALYQTQVVLKWLHTLMGGTPKILNEVDALNSMI